MESTMAKTITTGQGEAVTVAPIRVPVRGGLPEDRVQLLVRRGVFVFDRVLTKGTAREIGAALLEMAGEAEHG